MQFIVTTNFRDKPSTPTEVVYLVIDNWNDFGYKTTYYLEYVNSDGQRVEIGGVKFGRFNMKEDEYRVELPDSFERLEDSFFSIGTTREYYEGISRLGADIRTAILTGLRDLAFDDTNFAQALNEQVTKTSLLRSVSVVSIRGQFRRLAKGKGALSAFSFEYLRPEMSGSNGQPEPLGFRVVPDSKPPSNIHVLIGRNGVGKSHCFASMAQTIVGRPDAIPRGKFIEHSTENPEDVFANLVFVAFSLFDSSLFSQIENNRNPESRIQFYPIGIIPLNPTEMVLDSTPASIISYHFEQQFFKALELCTRNRTIPRWKRIMRILESDPILKDCGFQGLDAEDDHTLQEAKTIFKNLSSGHKIICLTLTQLVAVVAERTLVLIDEPESHLHPPLLSAFIRALSELLIEQNGVAIIATHSPVVLQEVPRDCVWILDRSGRKLTAYRPTSETFGENVGTLTRDVFHLEVAESGYNNLLIEAVAENDTYDSVLNYFDGKLGSEARAIVRGLTEIKNTQND
ncbi:MAG: AAA family ATPase [Pyrinomonadaceae bacterium]